MLHYKLHTTEWILKHMITISRPYQGIWVCNNKYVDLFAEFPNFILLYICMYYYFVLLRLIYHHRMHILHWLEFVVNQVFHYIVFKMVVYILLSKILILLTIIILVVNNLELPLVALFIQTRFVFVLMWCLFPYVYLWYIYCYYVYEVNVLQGFDYENKVISSGVIDAYNTVHFPVSHIVKWYCSMRYEG